MSLSMSMRGNKAVENLHYRQNVIARYYVDQDPQNAAQGNIVLQDHTQFPVGVLTLQAALLNRHAQNKPLLWTFGHLGPSQANAALERCEINFGYDMPIGADKIGHAALTGAATIAGEIHPWGLGANCGWIIGNQSGAWGAMPALGMHGKTNALHDVALIMTNRLGITVTNHNAVTATGGDKVRGAQLLGQTAGHTIMNAFRSIIH
jgi:hypothetical protein